MRNSCEQHASCVFVSCTPLLPCQKALDSNNTPKPAASVLGCCAIRPGVLGTVLAVAWTIMPREMRLLFQVLFWLLTHARHAKLRSSTSPPRPTEHRTGWRSRLSNLSPQLAVLAGESANARMPKLAGLPTQSVARLPVRVPVRQCDITVPGNPELTSPWLFQAWVTITQSNREPRVFCRLVSKSYSIRRWHTRKSSSSLWHRLPVAAESSKNMTVVAKP